jgi:hypothetical protein
MLYGNAALGYLNFLHGVNPISTVMLTNMYDYGAEKPCDEMYHGWFGDGTIYDNAQSSLYGPAPGYQPGGFNPNYQPDPSYGGTIEPPQFQPSLKSYKDWNTSWPENSWEITETSISNQGSYIKLLSKFVELPPCIMTVASGEDNALGSLRAAIACAEDGDTIRIDLNPGDTIELLTQLVIDKDLVLLNENGGHAPVYALGPGIGIEIEAGAEVHFFDLLLGGTGSTVLSNDGTVHLHDCRVDASEVTGTAVLNGSEGRVYGVMEINDQ